MGSRVARATRMLRFSSAVPAGGMDTACLLLPRGTPPRLRMSPDHRRRCLGALALPAGGAEEVTHAYASALSIDLRQRGSHESKPVGTPHATTAVDG